MTSSSSFPVDCKSHSCIDIRLLSSSDFSITTQPISNLLTLFEQLIQTLYFVGCFTALFTNWGFFCTSCWRYLLLDVEKSDSCVRLTLSGEWFANWWAFLFFRHSGVSSVRLLEALRLWHVVLAHCYIDIQLLAIAKQCCPCVSMSLCSIHPAKVS